MSLTVAEQQTAGSNSVGALTFTLGAGSAVGDLLVVIFANDFATLAALATPTGTAASTWTLRDSFDGGSNFSHIKTFTAPVTTAGAKTVICTNSVATDEHAAGLWRIPGAAAFDVANHGNGASTTSHVAPSLTLANNDEIMCMMWCGNNGGNTGYTYTAYPASPFVQGTERDFATFTAFGFGYQPFTSGASTGTKTATASTSVAYCAASILVKNTAPPPGGMVMDTRRRQLTQMLVR